MLSEAAATSWFQSHCDGLERGRESGLQPRARRQSTITVYAIHTVIAARKTVQLAEDLELIEDGKPQGGCHCSQFGGIADDRSVRKEVQSLDLE